MALYPAPIYPYYDPFYWGGFVAVGFGGPFIFIDRFHHRYPVSYVHFSRRVFRRRGMRSGGWHGAGPWQAPAGCMVVLAGEAGAGEGGRCLGDLAVQSKERP